MSINNFRTIASVGKLLYKTWRASSLHGLFSKHTFGHFWPILPMLSRKYRENTPKPCTGRKPLGVKTQTPVKVINFFDYDV